MHINVLDYAPREEFDAARFVAHYLRVLAVLPIVWMIVEPILFDTFHLDLSPIVWFGFASALKRRSKIARKWLIGICGFAIVLCLYLVVHAILFGSQNISLRFGRPVHNPTFWQVLMVSGIVTVIFGIPFCILLSKSARRQFAPEPTETPAKT